MSQRNREMAVPRKSLSYSVCIQLYYWIIRSNLNEHKWTMEIRAKFTHTHIENVFHPYLVTDFTLKRWMKHNKKSKQKIREQNRLWLFLLPLSPYKLLQLPVWSMALPLQYNLVTLLPLYEMQNRLIVVPVLSFGPMAVEIMVDQRGKSDILVSGSDTWCVGLRVVKVCECEETRKYCLLCFDVFYWNVYKNVICMYVWTMNKRSKWFRIN